MKKLIPVIALATCMISVTAFATDPTSGIENFPMDKTSTWKGVYYGIGSGCSDSGVPATGTATLNINSPTYQDNYAYGAEVLFNSGGSLQLDNVSPSFHGLDQPTLLNSGSDVQCQASEGTCYYVSYLSIGAEQLIFTSTPTGYSDDGVKKTITAQYVHGLCNVKIVVSYPPS